LDTVTFTRPLLSVIYGLPLLAGSWYSIATRFGGIGPCGLRHREHCQGSESRQKNKFRSLDNIHKIDGREYGPYWYKVESVREGKRIRQRVLEYLGKDRPFERETLAERLKDRDSNVSRALHVFRTVREWITFDSVESALRDLDSTNIVKLQTSTFCRALHH